MGMVKKKTKKIAKTKGNGHGGHTHVWDIPARYFPRGTSKAKEYADEVNRTASDLIFTNRQVQYSAQICAYNIKSIYQKNVWGQQPSEVFETVQEFVYHYENFCQRLYVHREKLLQFVNAIIPIGYTDKEVRVRHILINPYVKQAGITALLEKFGGNENSLGKVINDRTKLTHRLLYDSEFDHYFRPITKEEWKKPEDFKKWCDIWRKQVITHAGLAERCTQQVSEIDNEIAGKIIKYKDAHK